MKQRIKSLNEYQKNVDESIVVTTIAGMLGLVAAAICGTLYDFANDAGGWKNLVQQYKDNRKVKAIVDRLLKDPEVVEIMEQPEDKRHADWRTIIELKLDKEEKNYLKGVLDKLMTEGLITEDEMDDLKEFDTDVREIVEEYFKKIKPKEMAHQLGIIADDLKKGNFFK